MVLLFIFAEVAWLFHQFLQGSKLNKLLTVENILQLQVMETIQNDVNQFLK